METKTSIGRRPHEGNFAMARGIQTAWGAKKISQKSLYSFMSASFHASGWRRWVRVSWTLLTYVFAFPALLMGLVTGAIVGLFQGLMLPTQFGYKFRAGLLRVLLTVLRPILQASTSVYNAVFQTALFKSTPLPRPAAEFLVVGHRGSPTKCAENTLLSYETALKEGANAIEIDLCFTADGEVALWHDWDPDSMVAIFRETGQEALQRYRPVFAGGSLRQPVPKLTLAQLREHCGFTPRTGGPCDPKDSLAIPTYREFLDWAAQQRKLRRVFLDMKIPPEDLHLLKPMMTKMVADYDAACPGCDVVFMTIYPEILAEMKRHFPDQKYCFDKEITSAFTTINDDMLRSHSPIIDAERLHHDIGSVGRPTFMMLGPWEVYQSVILHDLQYRRDRKLDIELISWTVNDPHEQKWLIEAGVDGILTDLPELLARKCVNRKLVQTLGSPVRMLRR